MKFRIVGFTLGVLIAILGMAEMIPALLDAARGHSNAEIFFFNGVVCLFFGGALVISNRDHVQKIGGLGAVLLMSLGLLVMACFAALPFYMADLKIDYADAVFEAMSGLTTTGTSVLSDIEHLSHGILLWRSMIQWIGGLVIIAFAIVLLPMMKIGGTELFQAGYSEGAEKIYPKSRHVLGAIFIVYIAVTFIFAAVYHLLGMSRFDAVNHAMTTISTGGFSTHDVSFGHYSQPLLHYAASLFMFLSALPFMLFVVLFLKRRFSFWRDEQVRVLAFVIAVLVVMMSLWLRSVSGYSVEESFRYSLFNLVSIISTTGYISSDYTAWGGFAVVVFLFATYIGGAAGSAAGGPKIMRLVIAAKMVGRQIKVLLYPRGYFPVYYQGRAVEHNVAMNVLGFLSIFVLMNVLFSVAVAMTGVDFLSAVTAVSIAMANSGGVVSFADFPDSAKIILSGAMLCGRLEVLSVLVLFTLDFWRK